VGEWIGVTLALASTCFGGTAAAVTRYRCHCCAGIRPIGRSTRSMAGRTHHDRHRAVHVVL
jgi:hypothetical protein